MANVADPYAAALVDYFGKIDSHAYRENDGRWYLEVVLDPKDRYLPFKWLCNTYAGRLVTNRQGHVVRWQAVGDRARQFLRAVLPFLQYRRAEALEALTNFELAEASSGNDHQDIPVRSSALATGTQG